MTSTFNKRGPRGPKVVLPGSNGVAPSSGTGGDGNPPNDGGGDSGSNVPQSFDQPVILRQSPLWTRLIILAIMGVTTGSVLWACLAKVEETIGVPGKLEPKGIVQVVQAPVGGVVKEVLVTEGEQVEQGQIVATLDEAASEAQIKANDDIVERLQSETAFYEALFSGVDAPAPEGVTADLIQRGRDRSELIANNRLYRAQISGNTSGLNADQLVRLRTAESRLGSQQTINQFQAQQLRKQLAQTREQLANAKSDLATNQEILSRLKVLNDAGAVAELQYLQQEQEVNNKQTEVDTLQQEIDRLSFQISQAEEEVSRTSFESVETLQDRIAVNDQRIAEIDSQIEQRIAANKRQLDELSSERAQLDQSVKYQALRAPVDGTVFNLKANQAGYVANSTEPMMEIVPQDLLVARVFIPSKDFGFIRVGQKVDLRIDAFSFSEFGDMEGTVRSLAADALPPDEQFPYYRYPAEIELDTQQFISNEVPLDLRSGMSLNANIKLRKRRVITFVTDLFIRRVDSLSSGN